MLNLNPSDQKEDGTLDDRRRDGGTNSTLRTKEQERHLTLNEHDEGDELKFYIICHILLPVFGSAIWFLFLWLSYVPPPLV